MRDFNAIDQNGRRDVPTGRRFTKCVLHRPVEVGKVLDEDNVALWRERPAGRQADTIQLFLGIL